MRRELQLLGSYLKAVLVEGWRLAFTALEVMGLLLIFWPQSGQVVVLGLPILRIIGLVILVGAFGVANFTIYVKIARLGSAVRLRLRAVLDVSEQLRLG